MSSIAKGLGGETSISQSVHQASWLPNQPQQSSVWAKNRTSATLPRATQANLLLLHQRPLTSEL